MRFLLLYAIFYLLVFGVYAVNRIEPMIFGLSFVYFYSLLVWAFGIALVIATALWR